MASDPLSVYMFTVVLVRRGFRYLMVREPKDQRWYFPAGAVAQGEDLKSAVKRLVSDSSGLAVEPTGLVAIEHMPRLPGWNFGRLRFVIEASIRPDAAAAAELGESGGFFMPNEIERMRLRGTDVTKIIEMHSQGRTVAPIDIYQVGLS